MKNNIGDLVVTKEYSEKTIKTVFSVKQKYLTTKQALVCEKRW